MTERWTWPVPKLDWLVELFGDVSPQRAEDQARRLQFVLGEFGPAADAFLVGGIPAMFALEEMKWTYVDGHFLSTILLAQVFVEQSIGGELILMQEDDAAQAGLSVMLARFVELGKLTEARRNQLSEIQRMRIAYGHTHVGLRGRGYMRRLLDKGSIPEELIEQDARAAISIVVDWMRSNQPDWNPQNPDFAGAITNQYGDRIQR